MDPKMPESSADPTSGKDEVKYKGVRLRKWGKWVSEIRLPNSRERIWLGSYDSAEKAARAFDAAQFCLRGQDGKFNFPESARISIDLVGGRAGTLTPSEIQEIASHYGNSFNQGKEEEPRETNVATLEPNHTTTIPSPVAGAFGAEGLDWPSSSNYYDNISGPNPNPDYGLMLSTLDHMHEDMCMTQHFGHATNAPEQEEQSVDESFLWNF